MARSTKDDDRKDDNTCFFGGIKRAVNCTRDAVAGFIHTRGEEVEDKMHNRGKRKEDSVRGRDSRQSGIRNEAVRRSGNRGGSDGGSRGENRCGSSSGGNRGDGSSNRR